MTPLWLSKLSQVSRVSPYKSQVTTFFDRKKQEKNIFGFNGFILLSFLYLILVYLYSDFIWFHFALALSFTSTLFFYVPYPLTLCVNTLGPLETNLK